MAMAPSSPRLPSPPPPAEIQIGPKSPSGGGGASAVLHTTHMEQSILDASSRRRIHPGTKAADMASGPPLVPLNELNSAFQLQEHLAALHHSLTESGTKAITRKDAAQLAQPPPGIDRTLWLYELCRFLISQCNLLIVGFLFDTPACSATTCPEMRASEWQFLCAVHEQPKSCCAIDYCCHTLDWAANVVTDQKIFPSRFAVMNDAHSNNMGVKNLVNVFRRLHRIFAHAWFQHRSVFWSVEAQTGLYVLFKSVCDLYDLLPAENYKLPPEAEGLESSSDRSGQELDQHHQQQQQQQQQQQHGAERRAPSQILKPSSQQRASEEDNMQSIGRTNTRRHIRSSPSTGSAVTTVMEADEEDGSGMASKMRDMHIATPDTVEEEEGLLEEEKATIEEDGGAEGEVPATSAPISAESDLASPHSDDEADETVIEEATSGVVTTTDASGSPAMSTATGSEDMPAAAEGAVAENELPEGKKDTSITPSTNDGAEHDPEKEK